MISSSILSLIFHILFTTAIGNVSVKILQINLSYGFNIRENLGCGINYSKNNSDIVNFIRFHKPDVVLWLRLEYDSLIEQIKSLKLNIDILPLTYRNVQNCYKYLGNMNHTNCYYSSVHGKSKLIFLITNTLLWTKKSDDSEGQFKWLSQTLQIAEKLRQNVIIAGYKSPGSLEISNGSLNYASDYNKRLVELFLKYSNTIKGCLFGNENIDTFRIILNKAGKPMLPIFISPLSSNKYVRVYNYNQNSNELDNYIVYQRKESENWKEIYNCKTAYGLTNMNATSWFKLAQSFLTINSSNFKVYQYYSLRSDLFKEYCKSKNKYNETTCIKCRSNCFITRLKENDLESCLKKCKSSIMNTGFLGAGEDPEQNNGFLFVFAVIAGFVIILVGIVLAVNKVYCIRRGRQRNIFLAPLTLNIQAEIVDDNQNLNLGGKETNSKDDIDTSQIKNSNGFRRSNHEVEQTYNYIRM